MAQLSLSLFRSLVSQTKSGLLVLNESGEVILWNAWMEKYSRISEQDALGCQFSELFPRMECHRLNHAIQQALSSRCPAVLSNVLNPHPLPLWQPGLESKHLIQQAISITPLTDDSGTSYCMLEISDVTPAVLRQKSLEMQVMERRQVERALIQAKDEVEQASQAKSQFLAVISHEIRTPLNGIIGMAQLMRGSSGLTRDVREQACVIEESGMSLLELINDILDYTKIEVNKVELENISFDIQRVVLQVCQLLKQRTAQKGIKLVEQTHSDVSGNLVCGDQARIRQILYNLVGNAVKFTHEGEVRVSLDLKKSDRANGVDVIIDVSDTGIGIAKEDQARLFEAFTQQDSSISREYGGTGLGLAITKQLVELMSGTINIESALGEGTRFIVTLPLQIGKLTGLDGELEGERSINLDGVKEKRALVVDDNNVNLLVATSMLKRLSIEADTGTNGKEALNLLQDNHYDFVLMDIKMPVMDGEEAIRVIRQQESGSDRHLPVIALTGNCSKRDIESYLASGMDYCLGKPLIFKDLENALSKLGLDDLEVSGSATKVHQGSSSIPLLDYQHLASLRELLGDDYVEMVSAFFTSVESTLGALSKALETGDQQEIIRLLQSIESAANNIGAPRFKRMAKEFESLASKQLESFTEESHAALSDAYHTIVPLLVDEMK